MTFLVYLTWKRATHCYLIHQNTFRSASIINSCLLTKPSTVSLERPLWLAKAHTWRLKLLACCLWHWTADAVVKQESRQKGWGLKSHAWWGTGVWHNWEKQPEESRSFLQNFRLPYLMLELAGVLLPSVSLFLAFPAPIGLPVAAEWSQAFKLYGR